MGSVTGGVATGPLGQLRLLLFSFVAGLVMLGVVAVILASSSGDDAEGLPVGAAAGVVAVVGVVGWLLGPRLGPRLDCSTAATLVATYRSRFLVRLGTAEAAALTGFVMVVLTGEPLLYALGLAFTLVGFLRAAPSARNLARDQEDLAVRGCAHPLAETLRGSNV
ncbi:MAG TPA: hypothetical protein VIL36_09995 [Acidimicrobiales bacterium]